MSGQVPIKAVLKQDVNYIDMTGTNKTVKRGQVVDLYIVDSASETTSIDGRRLPTVSGFVAVKGLDAFDVSNDEFKTID